MKFTIKFYICDAFIRYITLKLNHMAHSPAPSTSGTSNTTSKVLRDFILGGTSGAIAKTLAAPI